MNKILYAVRYFKHKINASTRYKIHSQFVFDFINNILRDKTDYADYSRLWEQRNEIASSTNPVETVDFGVGAGKKAYSTKIIKLGKIVRLRSPSRSVLKLLYRITKYYKPENILELGTSAGISSIYIKSGNPLSNMITMEGCANLASGANDSFSKLGLSNIDIIIGNFDNTLEDTLKKMKKVDFVFFDGNHREEPTLRYFEQCVQFTNENSIFVVDDIHWSTGMENAWNRIKKDNRVSVTIDLFWFGIVFFREGIEKQDFVLNK